MKTIKLNLYKFAELSDTAKGIAVEKFRDINVEENWYETVYDDFKEKAKDFGFEIDKIYFSGFSSQGDGAMFEGSIIDFTKFLDNISPHVKKIIGNKCLDLDCKFTHSGFYYHEKSVYINFTSGNIPGKYTAGKGWQGNIQTNMDILEENIQKQYESFCRDLYKALEKECDYLTSDKVIIETIEANEYDFTIDGKLYN